VSGWAWWRVASSIISTTPFDIAVGLLDRANVDTEAARDGRADLFLVQPLTLDSRYFQDIFRKNLQSGSAAED